jgi:hypothetical protein
MASGLPGLLRVYLKLDSGVLQVTGVKDGLLNILSGGLIRLKQISLIGILLDQLVMILTHALLVSTVTKLEKLLTTV